VTGRIKDKDGGFTDLRTSVVVTPCRTPTPSPIDILQIALRLGAKHGDRRYQAKYDLNGDGVVNLIDPLLAIASSVRGADRAEVCAQQSFRTKAACADGEVGSLALA